MSVWTDNQIFSVGSSFRLPFLLYGPSDIMVFWRFFPSTDLMSTDLMRIRGDRVGREPQETTGTVRWVTGGVARCARSCWQHWRRHKLQLEHREMGSWGKHWAHVCCASKEHFLHYQFVLSTPSWLSGGWESLLCTPSPVSRVSLCLFLLQLVAIHNLKPLNDKIPFSTP